MQITQKQRRVPDRCQGATDIAHDEDEKNDRMNLARLNSIARISGRIKMIEAPVVPTILDRIAPIARISMLKSGVPRKAPLTMIPLVMTNSANNRTMNGIKLLKIHTSHIKKKKPV